jgi:hypothetical protein
MFLPTRPPDPAGTPRQRQTLIIHDYDFSDGRWRWTGLNAHKYKYVQFAPGATLTHLSLNFWQKFSSIKSLIVPPSVESISSYCFCHPDYFSPLESITFEPGSKLREIDVAAFMGCGELKSIVLPASVEKLDGESFFSCGIRDIELEKGNRHFVWRRPCLMDIHETVLVRSFGTKRPCDVHIPDQIERIGRYCFEGLTSFGPVIFGARSKCRVIEERAFACCKLLNRICVPAGVTCLGEYCFSGCANLVAEFSFHAGSKLTEIHPGAFYHCEHLRTITIPESVETIGFRCFLGCSALTNVFFEGKSKLARIDGSAFGYCSSLVRFDLPSSVEFVGPECFQGCRAMAAFVFVSPPHVRELLDVPVIGERFEIPDCVEVVMMPVVESGKRPFTLEFGTASRLAEMRSPEQTPYRYSSPRRGFLRVGVRCLKLIREELEFGNAKISEPNGVRMRYG